MNKNNHFLIISNGHGEDLIACNLIRALKKHNTNSTITVCPLVGQGHHYKQENQHPIIQNPSFPSGGFVRSLTDLLKDILAGLIKHIIKQKKIIQLNTTPDTTVFCVGDVFCLWLSPKVNKQNIIFLPTAKSNTFMPHSFLERCFIRSKTNTVFTRDQVTANHLQKHRISSHFYGNIMMDHLNCSRKLPHHLSSEKIIGILPGSRDESIPNCIYILTVIETLSELASFPIYFCIAAATSFELDKLKSIEKWTLTQSDNKITLTHQTTHIVVHVTYDFLAVINQSDLIIGLAGTANEQAIELGNTVICFPGFGPQSSLKRFREQQKLMGNQLIICQDRSSQTIAQTCLTHLHKKTTKFLQKKQKKSAAEEIILTCLQKNK